jgi:hypothetical protein
MGVYKAMYAIARHELYQVVEIVYVLLVILSSDGFFHDNVRQGVDPNGTREGEEHTHGPACSRASQVTSKRTNVRPHSLSRERCCFWTKR